MEDRRTSLFIPSISNPTLAQRSAMRAVVPDQGCRAKVHLDSMEVVNDYGSKSSTVLQQR